MVSVPEYSSLKQGVIIRPIIGIDLDDVLLDFFSILLLYYNKYYGTEYEIKDISSYDLSILWQCEPDEAIRRVFEFYHTKEHLNAMPIAGSLDSLQILSKNFDLVVVTSKPESISSITYHWIDEHFPNIFKQVYFTNHYAKKDKKLKVDICKKLDVKVFIEDGLHNAISIVTAGIPVILLDRPWNQGDLPSNIIRLKNWEDITEYIGRMNLY
jgi:uncharacterized HAD superfamily protein